MERPQDLEVVLDQARPLRPDHERRPTTALRGDDVLRLERDGQLSAALSDNGHEMVERDERPLEEPAGVRGVRDLGELDADVQGGRTDALALALERAARGGAKEGALVREKLTVPTDVDLLGRHARPLQRFEVGDEEVMVVADEDRALAE